MTADPLAADMAWYRMHRSALTERYAGEYIAIVEGTVVDHDADFDALARRVFAERKVPALYMPKVTRALRVATLRSPRRARTR